MEALGAFETVLGNALQIDLGPPKDVAHPLMEAIKIISEAGDPMLYKHGRALHNMIRWVSRCPKREMRYIHTGQLTRLEDTLERTFFGINNLNLLQLSCRSFISPQNPLLLGEGGGGRDHILMSS